MKNRSSTYISYQNKKCFIIKVNMAQCGLGQSLIEGIISVELTLAFECGSFGDEFFNRSGDLPGITSKSLRS